MDNVVACLSQRESEAGTHHVPDESKMVPQTKINKNNGYSKYGI